MATRDLALVEDEAETNDDEFEVDAPLENERPKSKGFVLTEEDEDSENLVPLFEASDEGKEALKRIARQACEEFDTAWESTEGYRQRMADDWKLFAAHLPLKSKPFKDSADVHVPSMLENTTRLLFRAFDELFGDWSSIFKVLKVGPMDSDAEKITAYDNYQLTCLVNDFYRQQMRGMLAFFTVGDVVFHSYYDGFREQNCHECLTSDDFVVPYVHVTTRPDYSDVPHRTKILNLYRHQLQAMDGTWKNIDKVIAREKPDLDDDPESLWSEAMAEVHRIEKPTDQRSTPYKILWHETYTDEIPGQDKDRFVQVIVDYHTRTVLSLTIHEEPSWQEKLRYEREMTELEQYRQARTAHAEAEAAWGARRQELELAAQQPAIPPPPMADPLTGMPVPPPPPPAEMLAQHDAQKPQQPLPPTWMMAEQDPESLDIYPDPEAEANQPKRPRKEPIHTFTHAVCIEPMVGNLGIGLGRIQSDFNRALNIMMSQTIDSATLANASGLIVSGQVEFERPFTHGPGVVNVAKGISGASLKDNILPMQPGQANPQMFDLFDRIWSFAQSSAQAPEVLSGEPGKSGETFRGLNARIEQATKQLSVPTRTYALTGLIPVLKNNAKLNSMFLPEELVIYINDEFGDPQELKIGRRMYERDYRVHFHSDLRFVSRAQKVAEADEITAMATMANTPMAPSPLNPLGNMPFLQRALKGSLHARGAQHMVPYLGAELPQPLTPFGLPPPPPPAPPGMAPPGAAPGPAGAGPTPAPPAGAAPAGRPPSPPPQGAPTARPPSPQPQGPPAQ